MTPIFKVTTEAGKPFLAATCEEPGDKLAVSLVLDTFTPGGGEPPSRDHLPGQFKDNWVAVPLIPEITPGESEDLEAMARKIGRRVVVVEKPVSLAEIDKRLGKGSADKLFSPPAEQAEPPVESV